jgi:hypothetical protein
MAGPRKPGLVRERVEAFRERCGVAYDGRYVWD